MIFPNADVAFALASLTRGSFIQSLHASIEVANLFSTGKLRARWWWPRSLIPAGHNQVRPLAILRLRNGKQLHLSVGVIAFDRALGSECYRCFFKPAKKQRARELDVYTVRPIVGSAGNL